MTETQSHSLGFSIPADYGHKNIDTSGATLRINDISTISEAFYKYAKAKKLAIVTRHSIREKWYANAGDLLLTTDGKIAAENLGKKIGSNNFSFYSSGVTRCDETCQCIAKGMGFTSIAITQSDNLLGSAFFEGSWAEVIENALKPSTKIATELWKNNFIKNMPNGYSWWVTHDSVILPLVYNICDFNAQRYKNDFGLKNYPWVSPLTGIIIAIVGEEGEEKVYIEPVKAFETGLYDYTLYDDVPLSGEINLYKTGHLVATTYIHPNVTQAKIDQNYIFDKANTANRPLYCEDNNFNGCLNQCVQCTTCFNTCNASCYTSCVGCNSCTSCNSCQTECQLRGYGYVGNISNGRAVPLVQTKSECAVCAACNSCVNTYQINNCGWFNGWLCAGSCFSAFTTVCTGCWDGCTTAVTSSRTETIYRCGTSCMRCDASNYICTTCYNNNYVKGEK